MDKSRMRGNTIEPHLDDEQLLLFVDRQLSNSESAAVQSHVEICWSCQAELTRIQDAITGYVDYRKYAYSEEITPPPEEWRGFDRQLRLVAEQCGQKAPRSDWRQMLSPFWRPLVGVWNHLRKPVSGFSTNRISIPAMATSVAVLLAVIVFLNWGPVLRVSAAEIIQKVNAAQEQRIRGLRQPVVYQKLRVRRVSQGAKPDESVTVEIWNDVLNQRLRKLAGEWSQVSTFNQGQYAPTLAPASRLPERHAGETFINAGTGAPSLLKEVEGIYAANHLQYDSLLLPSQFTAWRSSLSRKEESVKRLRLENGEEAYQVTTAAQDSSSNSEIREMELVVRSRDWHPVAENLTVATHLGTQRYEISELGFQLATLSEFRADLFALPASPPSSPLVSATATPSPISIPPVSPLDLQIEALDRLDQVNALVQDQLHIRLTGNDTLEIQGVVPTEERKAEVLGALGTLANGPQVKVEISSAMDAQEVSGPGESSPIRIESVEVPANMSGGNPELRSYLAGKKQLSGTALDQEMQRYASSAVEHSIQAQLHALALKQIVNTFSSVNINSTSPKAIQTWRTLVVRHAQQVQRETVALHDQLAPVFAPLAAANVASSIIAEQEGDLKFAVERLCEVTAANDRVLWKALSPNADEGSWVLLKNADFWKSLKNVELLATNIVEKTNR